MAHNQPSRQLHNSPTYMVRDQNTALVSRVAEITKECLQRLGIQAEVYCRDRQHDDMPHVWIEIMTEESGLLIGERGAHLRALECVLRLLLRDVLPKGCRCLVDVNTYRLRRIEFLKRLAHDASRKCSRTRHAVTLEPMPASERRVVHLALSGIADVETESIGVEPQRRIVIRPCDPLAS